MSARSVESTARARALGKISWHRAGLRGRRHYTIRAIPYQDPEMEAARLKAVHVARVKIVPRV